MVCRKYCKLNGVKFIVNYDYKITKVMETKITLDGKYEVPIAMLRKYFTFDYCRTAHSFQGSSIDDAITIFDWKFSYVNRNWLYTAITRATCLDNVFFLDYEERMGDTAALNRYLNMKVGK